MLIILVMRVLGKSCPQGISLIGQTQAIDIQQVI